MRAPRSLLALAILPALMATAGLARGEDGFSPFIGHHLDGPLCAAPAPDGLEEGGEDGASPAGPAAVACVGAVQDPLLPDGWQAWAGWTPEAVADNPADDTPGRLESRAGVSSTEVPVGSYLAPVWGGTFAGFGTASTTRDRPQLGGGIPPTGTGTNSGTGSGTGTGTGTPEEGQDGEEEVVVLPVDDPSLLQAEKPPTAGTSATIPEPGSMALFATGLTALALLRRRGAAHPG